MLRVCVLMLLPTTALAADFKPRDPGHFGIGIGGGTRVNGISGKYTVHDNLSIQGVVGADSGGRNDRGDRSGTLAVSASALVEMPAITENDDVELGWCVGAGPHLAVGDRAWLGVHAVLGIEVNLKPVPLEFTLEYRPSIGLVNEDAFEPINFGGHLRWWF